MANFAGLLEMFNEKKVTFGQNNGSEESPAWSDGGWGGGAERGFPPRPGWPSSARFFIILKKITEKGNIILTIFSSRHLLNYDFYNVLKYEKLS